MTTPTLIWKCRDRTVALGSRALVMGVLNVTPDSFSDGGRYADTQAAVARGLQMASEGADLLDIGGESSRPGAQPVSEAEELARVIPVVERLAREVTCLISVDTTKAAVARRALAAGAHVVNDITALAGDPEMAAVVAGAGAGVVLMHMQGTPRVMQEHPRYTDVVAEVAGYLRARVAAATAQGVAFETIAIDPGIGFGKTVEHNVSLLGGLAVLQDLGRPVLVGVSRKSFLGTLTGRDVSQRLLPSLAAMVFAIEQGARIVRVHDVKESCEIAHLLAILTEAKVTR